MRFRVNLPVYAALFLTTSLAFAQSGIGAISLQVQNPRHQVGTPSTIIAPHFALRNLVDVRSRWRTRRASSPTLDTSARVR